jgi:hypothetical protein
MGTEGHLSSFPRIPSRLTCKLIPAYSIKTGMQRREAHSTFFQNRESDDLSIHTQHNNCFLMKLVEKFCTPLRKLRLHDVKLTGVCREALFMLSTRSIPIILYVNSFITYARFENLTAVTMESMDLVDCRAV